MNCMQCIQSQNLFSIDAILAPDRRNQSAPQISFSDASSVMREIFEMPQMSRTGLFTSTCKRCVIWPDNRQNASGLNAEVKTDGGTVSHASVRPDCPTVLADQPVVVPGMERWMGTKFAKNRNPRIPFSRTQVNVLEEKFRLTHYLSGAEVNQLAKQLALTETRVSTCTVDSLVIVEINCNQSIILLSGDVSILTRNLLQFRLNRFEFILPHSTTIIFRRTWRCFSAEAALLGEEKHFCSMKHNEW
ncbi:hypothetical protein P879_04260 [Paragonimus westermani]|uniref:Homeobox domain-containing protein n=1 Tax=Paragonimus westermani TaxID=34504 RepID=A0A8T0DS00_9TREM|nr:hypothetical protein P879_04260 [Paragonimus westermani]